MMRARSMLALCFLLLAAPSVARAYVIVFKDGSTLIAREPFEIDGDRAVVTLQSGTQTVLPMADIDLERTQEKNRMELGRALVLDTVDPREPDADRSQGRTLADVIQERRAQEQQEASQSETRAARRLRRTPAGNIDYFAMPRQPYRPAERAAAIRERLDRAGIAGATVLQGSSDGRVLVDIVTATRGDVLEALQESARALLDITSAHPEIEALELAMATQSRSRAGQFVLTPEDARSLSEGTISPEDFFVAKVLF